ncbi:hypothetical protein WA588_002239, partial [Blastocystis sp. NMH]
ARSLPYLPSCIRAFSAASAAAAEKLIDSVFNGVQTMKSLNDPFTIEKSSDHVTINKSHEKEFTISLLQNGNLRLLTPENHYNDYRYVEEDDAFENLEDGHNIIEAFTRDLLSNYNGCP